MLSASIWKSIRMLGTSFAVLMILLLAYLVPPSGLVLSDGCSAGCSVSSCRQEGKYKSPSNRRRDSARIAAWVSAKMARGQCDGIQKDPTSRMGSGLDIYAMPTCQGNQCAEPNPASCVGRSLKDTDNATAMCVWEDSTKPTCANQVSSHAGDGYLGDGERSSAESLEESSSNNEGRSDTASCTLTWRDEVKHLLHSVLSRARSSSGSLARHMARLDHGVAQWPGRPRSLFLYLHLGTLEVLL